MSLRIEIHNTGTLAGREGAGIGLRNCRERLALVYGDKATLTLAHAGGRRGRVA